MFDLQERIKQYHPEISSKLNKFKFIFKALEKLLHLEEIDQFIKQHRHLKNFAFLDAILKHFDFQYQVSNQNLKKIPFEGKLLIVANHPIGSLDGLALLRMIYDIRPDVRIVATPLLTSIEPLEELFLPIDNIGKKSCHKKNLENIHQALEKQQAVIIFPAGEVSRITAKGVKDGKWKTGFLRIAKKSQTPILPVFVNSRNSLSFYAASALYKPLGTMMLIHEMFKHQSDTVEFITGYPIEPQAWQELDLPLKKIASRFRKHLFSLKKNKSLFNTTATIAHPIQMRRLNQEIKQLEKIGGTQDGMSIYLMPYSPDSLLMQEIGRLRELAFRMVKEGTGKHADLDLYDTRYQHLLLWNEKEMEIVGAYRIGFCGEIIKQHGIEGLYSASLYDFSDAFKDTADYTMELGRSFVQPKYWGLRGLEYLWYGIGAVINKYPEIKYLFGAVSIPGEYPQALLQQMVEHYAGYYPKPASAPEIVAKNTYQYRVFDNCQDAKSDFKKLLHNIKQQGMKLPILYKQYTDLCEKGGVGFVNFAVDPDFNNCVDGLIWLELDKMKAAKKARYLGNKQLNRDAFAKPST